MPDPIELDGADENQGNQGNQGADQKVSFKSEADQKAALDALPEEPPADVVDIDAWHKEMDRKTESILTAKIDQNAENSNVDQQQNQQHGQSDDFNPDDWSFVYKGEKVSLSKEDVEELRKNPEFTFKNPRKAMESVINSQRYIRTKQSEFDSHVHGLSERAKAAEERARKAEEEAERLRTGKSGTQENKVPTWEEVEQMGNELDEIAKKIRETEDDDPALKNLFADQAAMTAKHAKAMRQVQLHERQTVEMETKKNNETTEQERQRQETERRREESVRRMQSFKDAVPELKSERSILDMDKDYRRFGNEVASVHYGKSSMDITPDERERALNLYFQETPELILKLKQSGVMGREPRDLRQYMVISEVDLIQQGREIDEMTGQWKDIIDPNTGKRLTLPDMTMAYDYYQRKKGVRANQLLQARKQEREEILNAIQRPASAVELGSKDGGKQAEAMGNITTEKAFENLRIIEEEAKRNGFMTEEEFIDELERKNASDPRVLLYNKSVLALNG